MGNLIIDAFEFCRLQQHQEGALSITDLGRVHNEAPDERRDITWSISGGTDTIGHAQLTLRVGGAVSLQCQRCLNPVDVDVSSQSSLILARSEEEVDDIEAILANDAVDVVVITKKIDIAELIEDEILLAIPQSVKHEVCPNTTVAFFDAVKKPSAFEVLTNLKL